MDSFPPKPIRTRTRNQQKADQEIVNIWRTIALTLFIILGPAAACVFVARTPLLATMASHLLIGGAMVLVVGSIVLPAAGIIAVALFLIHALVNNSPLPDADWQALARSKRKLSRPTSRTAYIPAEFEARKKKHARRSAPLEGVFYINGNGAHTSEPIPLDAWVYELRWDFEAGSVLNVTLVNTVTHQRQRVLVKRSHSGTTTFELTHTANYVVEISVHRGNLPTWRIELERL